MNRAYIHRLEETLRLREETPPTALADVISDLKGREILLYGAGAFGAENFTLFQKYGVTPKAFLDQNAGKGQNKLGIPVLHPDDACLSTTYRASCTVFISITVPKRIMREIKANLNRWGYKNLSEVQTITARQVRFEGTQDENPTKEYINDNWDKILQTLSLFEDEESKETFVSCICGHLLRAYDLCYETDYPVQYFDAGIPYVKGFSNFVDCGAYCGDSLVQLAKYTKQIETYIAFEPVVENFLNLSSTVDKLNSQIRKAYLFPCGVSDRTGSAKFSIAESASTIIQAGDGEILPLVCIDDAIKNLPVTLLKMDIEGAELSALLGAQRLIQTQKPDLAISVYHAANHFWNIPCLIQKLNSSYHFYLRAHTAATLESVLYCTTAADN